MPLSSPLIANCCHCLLPCSGNQLKFQRQRQRICCEMGSSEALQAAKAYRHLLKSVKKHIGKDDHKSHLTEYIAQEFRKSSQESDISSIQHKIKLARDYTFLLNSVHHHKDLLFSYNIAVDRSDEMKKVLGKSAASVGLQLPEVYQP